jgi:hypothetical protein
VKKLGKGWIVALVIATILLLFTSLAAPFLGCFYRNYQFETNVRLQIEAGDCQKTVPSRRTECCQCFLAFDGIRSRKLIHFVGSGLSYSYDDEHRIFKVTGDGEIKAGKNSVEVRSGHLFINGEQLPVRSTPLRVLVKEDGRLVNEFCDVG